MKPTTKKIAIIGQKGIPCTQGGVERFVEEIAARQVQLGYDIVVYTRPHYTDKHLTTYRGVRLVSIPSINTKHLDAISHTLLTTIHALFVERVDVLFIVNVGPAILSWLPRVLRPRVRVLGKFESLEWQHTKWGLLAKLSLKIGAWCICTFPHRTFAVSREIREYASRVHNKSMRVIHNGYSVQDRLQKTLIDNQLKNIGLIDDRYFFTASRLDHHKGIHYQIEAFIRLKKNDVSSSFSNIKLVISGEGFHTDDYVDSLRKLTVGRSDIVFTGHCTGILLQSLYEGATAYIHASEAEGMSMSLIEALGYCRVVIASDIEPNLEAVTTSEGRVIAHVFESGNVPQLESVMKKVVESDNTELGRDARTYVEKYYSWQAIASEVEQEYSALMPRRC